MSSVEDNRQRAERAATIVAALKEAYPESGIALRYTNPFELLIAVILCAAMSSTASELAALGATSTVDLYKRLLDRQPAGQRDLWVSKLFTVLWGCVAVGFATFASLLDNLIEAVNILGSIFYGTVLGLFGIVFPLSHKDKEHLSAVLSQKRRTI